MHPAPLKPRKALNKAYLKVKPGREQIHTFRENLGTLLKQVSPDESEEFNKNLLSRFLRDTYYHPDYFINTKGRNDLVIHNGKDATSSVGVIIEAKKPGNRNEMISTGNLNTKALQELVWYFLGERITEENDEVKHLIATNVDEWFVFDARLFDTLFAQDKALVKKFEALRDKQLSDTSTDFFYREIAAPAIEANLDRLTYTHFRMEDYAKPLKNEGEESKLIPLYKILSPEHLLKLPFVNDSNTLDKEFYSELLHIIGLSETKQKGKKLIERKKEEQRDNGSLLENTINQLDSLDKINRMEDAGNFGESYQDRLFNVGLELCITWINRILFLKLLEAQVIRYHKNDKAYSFLNIQQVPRYGDLNALFFSVLARKPENRSDYVKESFAHVPYLNSSLFEVSAIEDKTIVISNLLNERAIPLYSHTVLKDQTGKRKSGEMNTLEYLFAFLNAYDFSSEGAEEIQEENKSLINASVLGLIFEKINGYRDGSFFTPGFITMYMCRETIRRAVLQKFKDARGWECDDLPELYNKIDDPDEANRIINSLKICDPAVGSGHFLVSALNEIIAIKHELRIFQDRQGRRLKEYNIEVVNDELMVTDEDGELFDYRPGSTESQRVQEALFHEKQAIIEGCLFGVDINPNSVKICRLRLWIELLKNAYYNKGGQLETLPNIDINIKCGNSLISRFALDADLRKALKNSKWSIEDYQVAVQSYRRAKTGEEKYAMKRLIDDIKSGFSSQIHLNDPVKKRLDRLSNELYHRFTGNFLFEPEVGYGKQSEDPEEKREREQKKLEQEIEKLQEQLNEKKGSEIFRNAFEWRFEFPEVMDNEGCFIGFDVVIGNPPYIRQEEIKELKPHLKSNFKLYAGTSDVYIFFIEKGFDILKNKGIFTFIMPNKFMQTGYGQPTRRFLLEQNLLEIIDFGDYQVFEEATTYPCILIAGKESAKGKFKTSKITSPDVFTDFRQYISKIRTEINHDSLTEDTWVISNTADQDLLLKVISKGQKLENYVGDRAKRGILTGLTEAFVIDKEKAECIIQSNPKYREHLHPFLLGREVKSYLPVNPSKYLIKFEKGFTTQNCDSEPEDWFKKKFPEIYNHLKEFKEKAQTRTDKGDFYWELRACDYYDMFEKPKIMYQVFQVKPCFIYDENGLYCNNSMWFIPSDDKVLLGILNSKMGWWLISKYCTAIQNGYQLIWKYFSQIPIATGNEPVRQNIIKLADKILSEKKHDPNADTTKLEKEIDRLVYKLYGLTEEEIEIVENSIK